MERSLTMTKRELEDLLLKYGTVKQIAMQTGLTPQRLYKYLKTHQIPPPNRKTLTKEQLIDLYINQKLSSRWIAKQIGCTHQTIVNWLDAYNIKKNSRGLPPISYDKKIPKELLVVFLNQYRSIHGISKHRKIPIKILKGLMLEYNLEKIKIDKEYLEREYILNQKSIKQIAFECKVLDKTIYFYLKKFKISLMR